MRLLFVPTAATSVDGNEPGWLSGDRLALQALGFAVRDFDLRHCTAAEVGEAMDECDIVFVSGGNTFVLLHQLQRVGFASLLTERPHVIYAGTSAGAVVAGPDIAYAGEFDDEAAAPELATTTGMGLVPFAVLPHADFPGFAEKIGQVVATHSRTLDFRIINDNQALWIDETGDERLIESGLLPQQGD